MRSRVGPLLIFFITLAGAGCGTGASSTVTVTKTPTARTSVAASPAVPESAIKTAEGAITTVECTVPGSGEQSWGSGFQLPDGTVITANHVIQACNNGVAGELGVAQANTTMVTWTDPMHDLAGLKYSPPGSTFSTSLSLETIPVTVGEQVALVSFPGGYYSTQQPNGQEIVSRGTVTALAQTVPVNGNSDTSPETLPDAIEISGTALPGMSGGPAIDANGNVIGVIEAAPAVFEVLGARERVPRAGLKHLASQKHAVAGEVGPGKPQYRAARRSHPVDQENRRHANRRPGRIALIEQVLALDDLCAGVERLHEFGEKGGSRDRVGVDDNDSGRCSVAVEDAIHCPPQRAALAAQVRVVADHHLVGACRSGHTSRVVGAVVGNNHDLVEVARIGLSQERAHAPPDERRLVMAADVNPQGRSQRDLPPQGGAPSGWGQQRRQRVGLLSARGAQYDTSNTRGARLGAQHCSEDLALW